MESKALRLPVALISKDGGAKLTMSAPCYWAHGFDLRFHLNTDLDDSVFMNQGDLEGCLLFQEYWIKDTWKFYFDVNEDGELVGVMPPGWNAEIDFETGDLIIFPDGTKFEGINYWIIESDFIVQ